MTKKSFKESKYYYKNWSIVWKYLTGLVSVVLFSALVGQFILSRISQNALENAIGESSSLFAQEVMNKVDRILLDRIEYWRVYTTETELLNNLKKSNEEINLVSDFEEYIESRDKIWIDANSGIKESWMLDIYNNRESLDLRRIMTSFEDRYSYRVFGEAFVTDKKGLISALSNWTSDYYQADEDWWQKAVKDGLYVSDVVYDESAGMRSIEIGIRVDDKNGEFLGVMKVLLNAKEAIDVVNELIVENNNHRKITRRNKVDSLNDIIHAKILDKNGGVIYSSEGDVYNEQILLNVVGHIIDEEGEADYLLYRSVEKDTEDNFFVWARSEGYKDFPGLGWTLLFEYDIKKAFASVVNLKNLFLLIISIAVLFLAFYGILISRVITKPLKELLNVINRLEQGKKKERAIVRSSDEIGVLAQNFNVMADKLMEVDRLKTEFLSLAAHQLRTPLGIIRWNLEMLLAGDRGKVSKSIKTVIKDMYENNQRLISLVTDLLNVSRLDQGKVKDKPELLDLVEMIRLVVENLNIKAKEKHIVMSVQAKGEVPKVMIDREKFRETIENFVSNAIKYNKQNGSVNITVESIGKDIVISIKDTGIGIPKKDKKRLFEKFFRASNASLADTTGSGLGLYVAREYVKKWGGKMSYTSSNKGTEFVIKIPKKPKKSKYK